MKLYLDETFSAAWDQKDVFKEAFALSGESFREVKSRRTIRFEFTGPSVQAVLDKLPTAKIIERDGKKYLIEAEVYGNGIKMWLLSQGAWVKVVAPQDFAGEILCELRATTKLYERGAE